MALSEKRNGGIDMGFLTSHDLDLLKRDSADKVITKEHVDPRIKASEETKDALERLTRTAREDSDTVGFAYSYNALGMRFSTYLTTESFFPGIYTKVEVSPEDEKDTTPTKILIFKDHKLPDYQVLLDPNQFSMRDRLMHPRASGLTAISRDLELPILTLVKAGTEAHIQELQFLADPSQAA